MGIMIILIALAFNRIGTRLRINYQSPALREIVVCAKLVVEKRKTARFVRSEYQHHELARLDWFSGDIERRDEEGIGSVFAGQAEHGFLAQFHMYRLWVDAMFGGKAGQDLNGGVSLPGS